MSSYPVQSTRNSCSLHRSRDYSDVKDVVNTEHQYRPEGYNLFIYDPFELIIQETSSLFINVDILPEDKHLIEGKSNQHLFV